MGIAAAYSATERGIREKQMARAEAARLVAEAARQAQIAARISAWFEHAEAKATEIAAVPPRATGASIIREVAKIHGVFVTQIKSASRSRSVCIARQHAAYEMRRQTKLSLPEIGRMLGGRDHSTICHAVAIWPEKAAKLGLEAKPIEGRG